MNKVTIISTKRLCRYSFDRYSFITSLFSFSLSVSSLKVTFVVQLRIVVVFCWVSFFVKLSSLGFQSKMLSITSSSSSKSEIQALEEYDGQWASSQDGIERERREPWAAWENKVGANCGEVNSNKITTAPNFEDTDICHNLRHFPLGNFTSSELIVSSQLEICP
ncbi:hypothetical protein FGO68_gene2751 [Halteria grandinella]|uniref:Uncharacterized protein n=1 Tax=Halteria grandinella TaxID=5974 RepID=A0A8J8NCA0_HALGN|nr:hypothetical protein FGO68_gene2751 [Halteria grandinella]